MAASTLWTGSARIMGLPLLGLGLALSAQAALAIEATDSAGGDNTNPGYHATETVDACMRKWDPGTHMSREAWRASCVRIKSERESYVKGR